VSGIGLITQFVRTVLIARSRVKSEFRSLPVDREKRTEERMGRFIQVALAAADFRVKSATGKKKTRNLDEVGVYVSSGIGGVDSSSANTGTGARRPARFHLSYSFRNRQPRFRAYLDSLRRARADSATATVAPLPRTPLGFLQNYRARRRGNDESVAARKRPSRRWASADLASMRRFRRATTIPRTPAAHGTLARWICGGRGRGYCDP